VAFLKIRLESFIFKPTNLNKDKLSKLKLVLSKLELKNVEDLNNVPKNKPDSILELEILTVLT